MADIYTVVRHLIFLGLFAYFVTKVVFAVQKLQATQVGTSFHTRSAKRASYPAITTCGYTYDSSMKKKTDKERMKEAELEDDLFVKLSYSYLDKNSSVIKVTATADNMTEHVSLHKVMYPDVETMSFFLLPCVTYHPPAEAPSSLRGMVSIIVNVTRFNTFYVFIYNPGQLYIPNRNLLFGSNFLYTTVQKLEAKENGSEYYVYVESHEIVRTSMTLLDLPKQRCDDSNNDNKLAACTAKYLEATVGCRMTWEQPRYGFMGEMINCSSPEQYNVYSTLIHELENGSEEDYYLKTGCLMPCKRSKFELKQRMIQTRHPVSYWQRNLYQLMLTYVSGTYESREEYLVYDTASMIGDIGGYLGLLLGHSIYSVMADTILTLKQRIGG